MPISIGAMKLEEMLNRLPPNEHFLVLKHPHIELEDLQHVVDGDYPDSTKVLALTHPKATGSFLLKIIQRFGKDPFVNKHGCLILKHPHASKAHFAAYVSGLKDLLSSSKAET